MPTFDIQVDFEIYCGTCGSGLCRNGNTDTSRNGNYKLTVDACERCIDYAKESVREECQDEIDELRAKIAELEYTIKNDSV